MTASSSWPALSRCPDGGPVLLALMRRLGHETDPAGMYRAVDEALARLVSYDRLAIGRVHTPNDRITIEYESGAPLDPAGQHDIAPADRRALARDVVHRDMSVLHTVPDDMGTVPGDALRRRTGIRQVLVSPIVNGGVTVGVLELSSEKPDRFTEDTVRTSETFSRVLGLALPARPFEKPDTAPETNDDELLEMVARILRAGTLDQLTEALHRELGGATGASILRFGRLPDQTFALAEAHDAGGVCGAGQGIDEAGETLAQRLPNLLTSTIGPSGAPEGALFTDLEPDGHPTRPTRDLGNLGDLFNTNAVVIAPLYFGQEPFGALVGVWSELTPLDQVAGSARRFLRCSELIGPALHRIEALEQMQVHLAERETIRRLTDSIARTPRFHDALDIICRTSQLVTGLDFVAISETTVDHVIWHSVSGAMDPSFLHQRLPIPNRILADILQHRQDVVLEDVRNHPELKPDIMPIHTRENLRSSVVVPIYVDVRLRAIVVFASRRLRTFSPDELATFHAIAGTTATAFASNDARMGDNDNE